MICFGAVDAILSLSLGKMVQYTGRLVVISLGAVVTVTLYALLVILEPVNEKTYLYYIASGFLGLTDAIFQTQVSGMILMIQLQSYKYFSSSILFHPV